MNSDMDWPLPEWAVRNATPKEWEIGAQLATKDGRVTGNAVIVADAPLVLGKSAWYVVTDAGSVVVYTRAELTVQYYPPRWIMDPLSAPGVMLARLHSVVFK